MRFLILLAAMSVAVLFTGSCASACRDSSCCVRGGSALTESPFRLEVDVQPTRVTWGTNVIVRYTLANTVKQPVASCASGWDYYVLIDATGARHSHAATIGNGYSTWTDPFRLPPETTLTWQVRMVLPDVAPGPAQFQGVFRSLDGSWVGTVHSKSVDLEIY
jgi:hypothetical protein